MKTVTVDTAAARPGPDAPAHDVAAYLAASLFHKTAGALHGRWDEPAHRGVWFYSPDDGARTHPGPADEVLYQEGQRWRFRSVTFRLGSMASATEGTLGGDMRLLPREAGADPGPPRRYVVRASFVPEAGLWFEAVVVADAGAVGASRIG